MARQLPNPITPTDEILMGVYERLGELLDLHRASPPPPDGSVALREPAQKPAPRARSRPTKAKDS